MTAGCPLAPAHHVLLKSLLRFAGELRVVCQPPSHLLLLARLRSLAMEASEVGGSCPSDLVEQDNLSPDSTGAQNTPKPTQHHSCKHLGNSASHDGVGSGKGCGCKDKPLLYRSEGIIHMLEGSKVMRNMF